MLTPKTLYPVLIAGLVSILAACVDPTATVSGEGPCDDRAAASLVGGPKPTDAEAMKRTNAKSVRQIEPGQMVTHDYREDRVTIETDPVSGRVVGAMCG
ncbi:hypothetical protein G9X64_01435 [Rhizobium sophorae]|uniref:Peptidase inhibitor I78 family protein n=1 Tax=Rhizobium sophorae TaxID=1535242 RepID=A0A7Y3WCU6_9HYPH|nr:I78 family peptidase inhibitor [Rhizobium sophorae]MBX4862787.1 hypothetical protein [Rhizobium bangladeshense]NKL38051.1 hypothetical protein [Rhizobium leguminosarum bv. viciae]NNU35186.1 hypothetical protein [Rhizobium sophorae]